MKIIHISDIHINPDPILGHDPVSNFRACLAHVENYHSDADRIVITGDLTHHGLAASYVELRGILDNSSLRGAQKPRLLIGNHDNRETYLNHFPEAQIDDNGFVQWCEETADGLFVYMDTVEAGTHAGRYGPDRQAWLAGVLESAEQKRQPAWLFLHHNPVTVHVANADVIGIAEQAEMQAIFARHRDTIRHIFFGHCHYTLSGNVAGIPFSAPRSTNHACWPDFSGIVDRMGHGDLQPNYNVCFLDKQGVIIHSIDFLDESKVLWRLEV